MLFILKEKAKAEGILIHDTLKNEEDFGFYMSLNKKLHLFVPLF